MEKTLIADQIAAFESLANVPRDQVEWVVERGELRQEQAGNKIITSGEPIDHMFFMLEGVSAFRLEQNGQYKELGRIEVGTISGALPYSRGQFATANGVAITDCTAFFLHKKYFKDLICTCHELTEVLVHQMTDRVRNFTRFQQQNEKLMALGKLSAGLAHELNNPAAAIVRSAESLQSHLGTVPDKFKKVISMKVNDDQIDYVNDLVFGKLEKGIDKSESLMAKTEREDDLTDWLDDNGYGDCYMLSETLADYGFCADDLDGVKDNIGETEFPSVIEWIDNVLTTEKMVGEIKDASSRISKLVNSVKSYSHMDRSDDFEQTDLHEGIHTTLNILNHKLKKNKVEIVEELDNELPAINAQPGELNQVWTNVIDNALDAMENDGGTLKIQTLKQADNAVVKITDSGPGIPEDVKNQIFDPFFTTKDVGKGTGLGLEVVMKIVEKHKGRVSVESVPGETTFEFCFPINSK